ncbi:MAG: MaoC family dehydratase [Alphaproteobacteria bacterium]|nr:MaoC family dehydratase [Alphaproteobacteria bacterium]
MGAALFHIDQAEDFVGREIAVSDWITIDQDQVDQFAQATRDPDWMHVDVERSRRESPYQGTIVQGFLMMSLAIHLHHITNLVPGGTNYGLNYGMDRVRFTDVVMVGARVRDHVTLLSCEPKGECVLMKTRNTLEVEGKTKPGMVADWLVYWYRS